MIRFFVILIITVSVKTVFAQNFNRGRIKQRNYFELISYQQIKGLPVVPVTIHGKTYNFLFDTGAMFAISDKLYRETNPPIIGYTGISGSSGDIRNMRIIRFPELFLQGITFINTRGVVLHEKSEFFDCLEIDGIIGSNMLRNSTVQIDNQSKHIIITNKLSSGKHEYQKMIFIDRQSRPYIYITMQKGEKKINQRVLFDSGMTNFFDLNFGTAIRNVDVVDIIAESEGILSLGIHGIHPKQKHLLLHIPEVVISNLTFKDVIITTANNSNSRIGAKLLEYGKVTLDFKKKRLYFNLFDNINTETVSENLYTFGITIQNDKPVVGIIWDKTLESEINFGDEVLSINGIDIQSWNLCQLLSFEFQPANDDHYVELRNINTGEIKKVALKCLHIKDYEQEYWKRSK